MRAKFSLFCSIISLLCVSAVPQVSIRPIAPPLTFIPPVTFISVNPILTIPPTTPTTPESPPPAQVPTTPTTPPPSVPAISTPIAPIPTTDAGTTGLATGTTVTGTSLVNGTVGPDITNATGTVITPTPGPNNATGASNFTATPLSTVNASLSIVPFDQQISFSITVATTQAIAPIPTANVAQVPNKTTVVATSPQIEYQGIWTPVKSTCDPSVTASVCQDPLSVFNYQFKTLKGGAIYLGSTRDANAGVFVVMLDNVQTKIDGFSASSDDSCAFTFSKEDLSAGFHNLSVSYVGRSPQAPDTSSGSFELNGIQLIAADTSSGTTPNSSRSRVAEISSSLFVGLFVIMLLQGF